MTFSYFPGCTLKTKGKQLDAYGRRAAKALGFELRELDEWQCCGAVYPMARDEIATRLSSVRALSASAERGEPLVTLCSACHHVIKRVNGDMQRDADMLSIHMENPYAGTVEMRDGLPQTQNDPTYHGFGMRSMQRITEKHNGSLTVQLKDGLFLLDILLFKPLP